jgi:hypothetical protein
MAEVAGLVATILTISACAHKTAGLLSSIANDAPLVRSKIRNVEMKFSSFSILVKTATQTIEAECSYRTHPSIFGHLDRTNFFKNLSQEVERIQYHIEATGDRLKHLRRRFVLILIYKWWRLRHDISQLELDMESIKTTLILTLKVLKLASLRRKGSVKDAQKM